MNNLTMASTSKGKNETVELETKKVVDGETFNKSKTELLESTDLLLGKLVTFYELKADKHVYDALITTDQVRKLILRLEQ